MFDCRLKVIFICEKHKIAPIFSNEMSKYFKRVDRNKSKLILLEHTLNPIEFFKQSLFISFT